MQTMIVFLLGLAVMLFLMIKTKLGPFMSMLLGGLIIGMGCGVGSSLASDTARALKQRGISEVTLRYVMKTKVGTW